MPEFHALEPIWRELVAGARTSTAFQSWDFAVEWLNGFVLARRGGATGRFKVIVASDERAGIIGLAPLFEEYSLGRSTLGTTLQPFGRSHTLETLTDEPVAVFREGYEQLAARMQIAYAGDIARNGRWDIAVIYGARNQSWTGSSWISLSKRLETVEVTRRRDLPLVVPLPSSWQEFQSRLSKSMRDNLAYYPRRLTREAGPWKLQVARAPAEVARATEHLIRLHRKRCESNTGPAHRNHLPGEPEASFLAGWFQRLAQRDEVSLVSLTVGTETVAAQAFVEAERSVSVYYSGYDERWGRYSPLTVVTAGMIRLAISRGFDRLEFAPGESAWKCRWGTIGGETIEETSVYPVRLGSLWRGLARRLNQLRRDD